jgi:hypothetical protein
VELTEYVRPDLYQEHCDADEYDYDQAWIGVPALAHRAMQVSVNPDAYGWYTR